MPFQPRACAAVLTLGLAAPFAPAALAQTDIQWWHSMTAVNGEWVNDLARDFNASQKQWRVVPVYKGSYDESMTAAIAAFRAGNAPHILQVFEVGTATMMASRGAVVPVAKVMQDAGKPFDPASYVPAVASYYTAPDGRMLSFPFNSSTTVFYFNKDAFKGAGLAVDKAPSTWPEVVAAAGSAAAGWPFKVDLVEMLGAERLLHGRVGAAPFTLRLDGTLAPPRAGERLALHAGAERLHWFDPASGARVGDAQAAP